jgi:hypothetical protein
MGKRPSLIKAAIDRLDQQMRIGESRYEAKQAIRAAARRADEPGPWTVATGSIHSYGARATYQEQTLLFINWVRDAAHVRRLDELDGRADELATRYLRQRLDEGLAAPSLYTLRSALRQFFTDRTLAASLVLPQRKRADITRSRQPAGRDRFINREHWRTLIRFCRATGLRASEVRDLRVSEVFQGQDGRWRIRVRNGKGGKERVVNYVLTPPDQPGDLRLTLTEARATLLSSPLQTPPTGDWLAALLASRQPGDHVFARIPDALDIQAERRWYAQTLYRALSKRELPPATGRLRSQDYDRDAALIVTQQLGHNRRDVALHSYLR